MAENTTNETTESPFANQRLSDEARQRQEDKNKFELRRKLSGFLRAALSVLGAVILAYFVVLAALYLMGWTAAPLPFSATRTGRALTKENTIDVSAMSDEQLAAQMCMVEVDASRSSDFVTWTDQGIGALVLSGGSASATLKDDISSAQEGAAHTIQAFIVSDQEGNSSNPLESNCGSLPTAKQLGQMDADEIERTTHEYGSKLKKQGVNVVLGPVADVGHPLGALAVNEMSFGSECDEVIAATQAYVKGMNRAKVGTTLAHWPGLGSFAKVDDVVNTYRSWDDIEQNELRAFSETVDGKVTMVLVGHVNMLDLSENDRPASISKKALSYLRKDIGAHTIILTDDLATLERCGTCPSQGAAAVEAIKSGADMVKYKPVSAADNKVISELAAAIASGKISRSDAEAKVERIIRAKSGMNLSPELRTAD